jgi:hypothetical protein
MKVRNCERTNLQEPYLLFSHLQYYWFLGKYTC